MCKASITARNVVPATAGSRYALGVSDHGLPAFRPMDVPAAECVVCVKNGTTLTLLGIPPLLQAQLGVTAQEIATFIDTGDNRADMLRMWRNGKFVNLNALLKFNVTFYVGELEEPRAFDDDEEMVGVPEFAYCGA